MLDESQTLFIAILSVSVTVIWILFLILSKHARIFRDIPNERSSHIRITPRGAGFAFSCVTLLAAIITNQYLQLGIAGVLISAVGLWDDASPISAKKRLVMQLMFATLAIAPIFLNGNVNGILAGVMFALTMLFVLSAINFFNFADGINGHVALQTLQILVFWLILSKYSQKTLRPEIFPIAVSLIVSLGIFLFANMKLKLVFMGDAGSTFLGFIATTLPIFILIESSATLSDYTFCFVANFVFTFVIFADCLVILFGKMVYKVSYSQPHKVHFYQQLSRNKYLGHISASIILLLCQMLISGSFIGSFLFSSLGYYVTAVLMVAYVIVLIKKNIPEVKKISLSS